MANNKKETLLQVAFAGISLLSLCLIGFLTFNANASTMPPQRQLTGIAFSVICILGILAGVSPSKCSQILHTRKNAREIAEKQQGIDSVKPTIRLEGHHMTCGNFSTHVLRLGKKVYCAGCAGLVTGAIVSLSGSLLYFGYGMSIGKLGTAALAIGFAGVAFGLAEYIPMLVKRASVHFALNVVFVLGAFLLLVGVDTINGSLELESYLLILTLYWIATRIMLSQWEHKKICNTCGRRACVQVDG